MVVPFSIYAEFSSIRSRTHWKCNLSKFPLQPAKSLHNNTRNTCAYTKDFQAARPLFNEQMIYSTGMLSVGCDTDISVYNEFYMDENHFPSFSPRNAIFPTLPSLQFSLIFTHVHVQVLFDANRMTILGIFFFKRLVYLSIFFSNAQKLFMREKT